MTRLLDLSRWTYRSQHSGYYSLWITTALPYKITVFCPKSALMSFILGLLSANNDISPNSTHLLILAMQPQHNILEVLTAVMKIEICSEVWLCRLVNSYRQVKGSHWLHLQVQIVQDEGNTPCFAVRLDISHFRRCNSAKTAADFAFWVGSRARSYTQEKRKIFHLVGMETSIFGRPACSCYYAEQETRWSFSELAGPD